MPRESGTYVTTVVGGEAVKAFVPKPLPPAAPPLDPDCYAGNTAAEQALDRLSAMSGLVASAEWLIYSSIRKEALLTSQMEGTQATLTDLLDQESGMDVTSTTDVSDVTNYLQAFEHVRQKLRTEDGGLPISTRLLCQAHAILLDNGRGEHKMPGEIRRSQNWIGGTRPGNAVHVPPPHTEVGALLGHLEHYIHHSPVPTLPPLVRIALIHAQFETIHPFLDGHGRIGRLLIAALLEDWNLLPEPLLYVSGQLKARQAEYYQHLSSIRTSGDWESWIRFFLECTTEAAESAQRSVIDIASLIAADRKKVMAAEEGTVQAIRLFEMLPTMPRFTTKFAADKLGVTFPTASTAIKVLQSADVLVGSTEQKRNQQFNYKGYIGLLQR
ncbi:MAG: Fic family protein [Pseudolabrys sp.]